MAEHSPPDPATSGLRAKIVKGGIALVILQIVTIGLRLAGMIFITTLMGPGKFGPYIAAFGIFSFVLGIGQSGIGVFLMRQPGRMTPAQIGTATTLLLLMAVLIVGSIELAAGAISQYVRIPGFLMSLRIMILALPLQTMSIPALTKIRRNMDLTGMAVIELLGLLSYYALAVPLLLHDHGAAALAGCLVFQYAVMIVLAYLRAGEGLCLQWDGPIAANICRYTFSFSSANYIWQARSLVNPLVVGPVLGPAAAGIIGLTVAILEILTIPRGMFWLVTVAALGKVQGDLDRVRRAITEGMELQVLVIAAILLLFGWVGEGVMLRSFGVYGKSLFRVYPYVALLYLTIAAFNMHTAVLSVFDRNWWLAFYQAVHVAVFFAATAILIPAFGLIGYGYSEIGAIVTYPLLHMLVARRVGAPDYRLTMLWGGAAAIGLFWRQIGIAAIAAPFAVLLLPVSLRRLRAIAVDLRSAIEGRRQERST